MNKVIYYPGSRMLSDGDRDVLRTAMGQYMLGVDRQAPDGPLKIIVAQLICQKLGV